MSGLYSEYVARLKAKHGDKFSDKSLSPKFAQYWGRKLKVKDGEWVKVGRVTGTTGWQPSLMLIHHNAHGSSFLLSDSCEILKVLS